MKLYAFRSPAVMPLWERFAASVPRGFELTPVEIPSGYDGAQWDTSQYWALMQWLVSMRARLVQDHMGEVIALSGCDSVFYGDPIDELRIRLEYSDFLAVNDLDAPAPVRLCACLQVMRCTANVRAYQEAIAKRAGKGSDDTIMNELRHMVTWKALPRERFWSIARAWKPDEPVPTPPASLVWFHANWTVGVQNKLALLDAVDAARRTR